MTSTGNFHSSTIFFVSLDFFTCDIFSERRWLRRMACLIKSSFSDAVAKLSFFNDVEEVSTQEESESDAQITNNDYAEMAGRTCLK